MARETSGDNTCGAMLSLANVTLLIVAAVLEGKLGGGNPTCQYNMTVMAIVFAVLYGLATMCACCLVVTIVSSSSGCCCCCCGGGPLVVIAALVGLGTVSFVITLGAVCNDYHGEFLWVMIVINGSMSLVFAGLGAIAMAFPSWFWTPKNSAEAPSAVTTTAGFNGIPAVSAAPVAPAAV
jgi:hypothetical protein